MTPPPAATSVGDLGRLLDAEARLEERLRTAAARAAAIVATAREASAARERALTAEVEEIGRRLEAEAAQERARRIREVEETGRHEVETFDALDGDRIAALARHVVARVIGEGPP